jgi:hypothetical protein
MDFWLEMAKPDRYTLEKKYMLLVLKKTAR